MKIAIIEYTAGNVQSVINALYRLGYSGIVTRDLRELKEADKIIFPGVGEAGSAMQSLKETGLDKLIPQLQQPLLGICVGMQLLCSHSEENDTTCLGVLPLKVKKFEADPPNVKVPQMGWNRIYGLKTSLFDGVQEGSHVYNVHSYYVEAGEQTIARCSYGIEYAAAIRSGNFYGVQFHSEKSAATGDLIIRNFIEKT